MPPVSPSPAGHAPAGLLLCPDIRDEGPVISRQVSALDRDDPRYWENRPSDHGPNGLFVGGPQPAIDSLLRDALGRVSDLATTHLQSEAEKADASRALRQALPIPAPPALPPHLARLGRAMGGAHIRNRKAA